MDDLRRAVESYLLGAHVDLCDDAALILRVIQDRTDLLKMLQSLCRASLAAAQHATGGSLADLRATTAVCLQELAIRDEVS